MTHLAQPRFQEGFSFWYDRTQELIKVYQNISLTYPSGDVDFSYVSVGTVRRQRLSPKEWTTIYNLIVKREKVDALLWRRCEDEVISWVCNRIIDGKDFVVSDVPLNSD